MVDVGIKMSVPLRAAIHAHDPTVVARAMRSTLSKVSNPTMNAALKSAFGKEGRFNLSLAKAKTHGGFRAVKRWWKVGDRVHIGIYMTGRRISLIHFSKSSWWYKAIRTRIGLRKGVRIKVMKRGSGSGMKWAWDKKGRKRSGKYRTGASGKRGEFGGFVARGRAGTTDGAGAHLIFQRSISPVGGRGARGRDRYPLVKMDTSAPSAIVNTRFAEDAMDKYLDGQFEKTLMQQLRYYQGRQEGKR